MNVLFEERPSLHGFRIGIATLDAEKSLNALSLPMIEALAAKLDAWAEDAGIACVLLRGNGAKAFCAGGDVRKLVDACREQPGEVPALARRFFADEYRLDYRIHTYPKPFICWAHGYVMGGGMGLMQGAGIRIVTPSSRLAMPEIGIGLYPDVGASWFLARLPGRLGLFLGLIGLKTAGIVVASPATLIKLGHLTSPGPLLAALCFLMIAVLEYRRVFGGILISILSVTLVGWALGLVQYGGVFSAPPSLAPTFLAMDIAGAFNVTMISVILAFLFVHMFDTAGTLMGVAQRAHLVKEDGRIENLSKAMKADSASSVFGGMLGVPPVTSYVESAAGVAAGGRTGLTAVVVGVLFVAAMFFAPLAGMIPAFATAGALIYVAMLMMGGMAHIDWDEHTETIPAIVTVIMMPLTFSVADGIALGFITYVAMKVLTGKHREVSASLYALFVIFVAKFIFL